MKETASAMLDQLIGVCLVCLKPAPWEKSVIYRPFQGPMSPEIKELAGQSAEQRYCEACFKNHLIPALKGLSGAGALVEVKAAHDSLVSAIETWEKYKT